MTNDNNLPSWEHDDEVHGYWIVTGRLLATEYPGAKDQDKALRKLQVLRDAGINSFVDLTEPGERTWDGSPMVPYNGLLGPEVNYKRFAIPDTKTISDGGYDEILAYINTELASGRVVLVACWGGKGRTGTVVGSWLIDELGLGYPQVIDHMQELRAGTRKADHPVPDTQEQHEVLRRRAQRRAGMDWFEKLTGFTEDGYEATQNRLRVEGDELVSTVNGKRYGIGSLSLPTLGELRARVNPVRGQRSSLGTVVGDVRRLHADPAYAGAMFQVASQFNLLEMVSERVTPEVGVAGYAYDGTQGPACAMAAGAGTIYRNYLVPVGDQIGQTASRQLDALAGVGAALSDLIGLPVAKLWQMSNGYALCTPEGLAAIGHLLDGASEELRDSIRQQLAIGLHRDVQVTDVVGERRLVSQAYCSALPVGYSSSGKRDWEPFARLVLEASYETVMLAALEQAAAGGSNKLLLTRIGGGVFGNGDAWIDDAIDRALGIVADAGLEVSIVCHGSVSRGVQALVDKWAQ